MDDHTLKLAQKLARQSAPDILKGVNEDHEEQDGNPLPLTSKFENKFKGLQRTRSLIGPSPIQKFGPRACINKNSVMEMTIQDPGQPAWRYSFFIYLHNGYFSKLNVKMVVCKNAQTDKKQLIKCPIT